jgi:putative PIN family toxin of toxin-antitoxin system
MLVVVDTNVMLSAFARQSPIARLFRALGNGEVRLAVTSAIILEYEEIAGERGGAAFAAKVMHWLSLVSSAWSSIDLVHPSFQFRVVSSDPDDNKFVDCAITAEADFLITNDSDFSPLSNAGYKPQPITAEDFIARYLTP